MAPWKLAAVPKPASRVRLRKVPSGRNRKVAAAADLFHAALLVAEGRADGGEVAGDRELGHEEDRVGQAVAAFGGVDGRLARNVGGTGGRRRGERAPAGPATIASESRPARRSAGMAGSEARRGGGSPDPAAGADEDRLSMRVSPEVSAPI